MSNKTDMRKAVRCAIRNGWRNVTRPKANHYRLEWVDGSIVVGSATPSCFRAIMNFKADLRRAERSALDKSNE